LTEIYPFLYFIREESYQLMLINLSKPQDFGWESFIKNESPDS